MKSDNRMHFGKSILVADNCAITKMGMELLLREMLPHVNIVSLPAIDEVAQTVRSRKPDLVIMDIDIQNGAGIDLITIIKTAHRNLKVAVFSGYDEMIFGLRCIRSGADGFINKFSPLEEVKYALGRILNNEKFISEKLKSKYISELITGVPIGINPVSKLSNRELEVATLLVKGCTTSDISTRLNLQKSTVSTYKNRVFEKLNVSNIIDLAANLKAGLAISAA